MADWKIESAHITIGAEGDGDSADVAGAEWPTGAHVGAEPIVLCLGVNRDDVDAAQIR